MTIEPPGVIFVSRQGITPRLIITHRRVRHTGPAREGDIAMKTVHGNGINYEVIGEREEEAAAILAEGLDAVSKRRNAYVDENIDVVLNSVREYGVDVKAVLRR